MKYPEYLSSAKRHNQACKVLQERIEVYESTDPNNLNIKPLVISLYYLSGYIIECSLKFKILEVSGFCLTDDVNKIECDKIGINYYTQIRVHDFGKLQDVLCSKITDLSYESDDTEVVCLLLKWDPTVRYEDIDLEYNKVKLFFNHANYFLKKM